MTNYAETLASRGEGTVTVTYLEAHRLAAEFAGGPPLRFLFGASGATDELNAFLKAAGAQRGRSVEVRTLPFNSLGQALVAEPQTSDAEVFVLFPWDFVPEGDWRSGLSPAPVDAAVVRANAQVCAERLARRRNARLLYVPAPLPPLFPAPASTRALEFWLSGVAAELGAEFMRPSVFSLGSYLSTGTPFAGTQLSVVAERIIERANSLAIEPATVLVTDLDNVMWGGVVGEDGFDGIRFAPEGVGFRHFLYQTVLAKLKREGTLIAAVSRNDGELARTPFASGRMVLRTDDFVIIAADYNAKSTQIRALARQLNLGLDAFVFVDENPIELEEVSSALPEVRVVRFPSSDDQLPEFFETLSRMFPRAVATTEDLDRTKLYRRRLNGMVPATSEGADLTAFLRGLEM
jgi:HAD superfamily phosphatase (TIGR01681 family)